MRGGEHHTQPRGLLAGASTISTGLRFEGEILKVLALRPISEKPWGSKVHALLLSAFALVHGALSYLKNLSSRVNR